MNVYVFSNILTRTHNLSHSFFEALDPPELQSYISQSELTTWNISFPYHFSLYKCCFEALEHPELQNDISQSEPPIWNISFHYQFSLFKCWFEALESPELQIYISQSEGLIRNLSIPYHFTLHKCWFEALEPPERYFPISATHPKPIFSLSLLCVQVLIWSIGASRPSELSDMASHIGW